jgi:hypothetical protein
MARQTTSVQRMLDEVVGNIISADHDPTATEIMMSNGLTSVFLDVLLLSGSELARTDAEVATIVSLAERDQSIVGLGIVGFDVSELGWTVDRFDEHKRFLLRVIDAAIARQRWHVLDYEPNTDRLLPCLIEFRELVEAFPVSACPQEAFTAPWSTIGLRSDRAMCSRHGVYLHNLNTDEARCCQLCNR